VLSIITGGGKWVEIAIRMSLSHRSGVGGKEALRDKLPGEIAGLQSGESATSWAQGALAAKNRLGGANRFCH